MMGQNKPMNTNMSDYIDEDVNPEDCRESFAIQGSIIMNTLTDMLQRVRAIERILRLNQDMHCKHTDTLDVYKTSRLVEEPPKKRIKRE